MRHPQLPISYLFTSVFVLVQLAVFALFFFFGVEVLNNQLVSQVQSNTKTLKQMFSHTLAEPLARKDYSRLHSLIQASIEDQSIAYAKVMDRDGKVLVATQDSMPSGHASCKSIIECIQSGQRIYGAEVPISLAGMEYGQVAFRVPLNHVYEAKRNMFINFLLIWISILLLSISIFLYLGYCFKTKLRSISREIQTGTIQKRSDEFAPLAKRFNEFIKQEDIYKKQLGAHKAELESTVKERTKELEASLEIIKQMNLNLEERVVQESQERIRQSEVLIQQNKMAELGNMVSIIVHQWKQPITAALMLIDVVKMELREQCVDTEIEGLIAQLEEQVVFMNQTMQDFREFYKPSKKKTVFDTCDVVKKVKEMFRDQYEKDGVDISIVCSGSCLVRGYRSEFMHVILNLFNNAKEQLRAKGVKQGNIICAITEDKNDVTIKIKDNGGGIDSTLLPDALFGNYTSTKGEHGSGIGLSICKNIIETHMEGKISASNTSDGAEFAIVLPLGSPEADRV